MAAYLSGEKISPDEIGRAISGWMGTLGVVGPWKTIMILEKSTWCPATASTYELAWQKRRYPPKATLGTAYEIATGRRLGSGDFEGGKTGAVRVLGQLGFTVQEKRRPARPSCPSS